MKWKAGEYREKSLTEGERAKLWEELLKNLRQLEPSKKFALKKGRTGFVSSEIKTIVIDGFELEARIDQERTHGWNIRYGRPYFKFGGYMRHRNTYRAIC